jgi:H/ACA ribonucleoprotein complex subunit 4
VNDGTGAPLTSGPAGTAETTSKADVLSAPPVAPTGEVVEQDPGVDANPQTNGEKKRKSKHEGETSEEKAERKRRKAEKKEKKDKKRKSKGGDDSDDSD